MFIILPRFQLCFYPNAKTSVCNFSQKSSQPPVNHRSNKEIMKLFHRNLVLKCNFTRPENVLPARTRGLQKSCYSKHQNLEVIIKHHARWHKWQKLSPLIMEHNIYLLQSRQNSATRKQVNNNAWYSLKAKLAK